MARSVTRKSQPFDENVVPTGPVIVIVPVLAVSAPEELVVNRTVHLTAVAPPAVVDAARDTDATDVAAAATPTAPASTANIALTATANDRTTLVFAICSRPFVSPFDAQP